MTSSNRKQMFADHLTSQGLDASKAIGKILDEPLIRVEGIKRGELMIFAGSPRSTQPLGKTHLMLAAAKEAGLKLVFPLEGDVTTAREFSKTARKAVHEFVDEVHQAHTPMPEPVAPPPVNPPPVDVDPPLDEPKQPLQ